MGLLGARFLLTYWEDASEIYIMKLFSQLGPAWPPIHRTRLWPRRPGFGNFAINRTVHFAVLLRFGQSELMEFCEGPVWHALARNVADTFPTIRWSWHHRGLAVNLNGLADPRRVDDALFVNRSEIEIICHSRRACNPSRRRHKDHREWYMISCPNGAPRECPGWIGSSFGLPQDLFRSGVLTAAWEPVSTLYPFANMYWAVRAVVAEHLERLVATMGSPDGNGCGRAVAAHDPVLYYLPCLMPMR